MVSGATVAESPSPKTTRATVATVVKIDTQTGKTYALMPPMLGGPLDHGVGELAWVPITQFEDAKSYREWLRERREMMMREHRQFEGRYFDKEPYRGPDAVKEKKFEDKKPLDDKERFKDRKFEEKKFEERERFKDKKFDAGMYRSGKVRAEIKEPYGVNEYMHFLEGGVTLTSSDGTVTEIRAGDSVVIPADWTGVWDTEGYTKIYVIYSPGGPITE